MSPVASGYLTPPSSPTRENNDPNSPTKPLAPWLQWKVCVDPSGKVDPRPSAEIWQKMLETGLTDQLLYRYKYKNKKGVAKRYVGSVAKTPKGNNLKRRFTNYRSKANADESSSKHPKTPIEKALARSPKKITVAVIAHFPELSDRELRLKEEEYIDAAGSLSPSKGFNCTRPSKEGNRTTRYNYNAH